MQEAFLNLVSGDFTTNLVFGIIIGLSFLLGMFVWVLLAHLPTSRKLKSLNNELETENKVLKKDNKDLSERYTVVQAKLNRTSEDLQTAEANLKEKNEKVHQQLKKNKFLSGELEVYKDNARNFKEANEKLMETYKKMSREHEQMAAKMEDMKGLIEEVEGEKSEMLKGHLLVADAKLIAEKKLTTTTKALEKATSAIELLKKDLEAALEQKAELKKMLENIEATQQLDGTNDEDLKVQLVGLKSHIRDLEAENSDLMERLAPYLAEEHANKTKEKEIDELLVNLLVDAEENMEQDGFYVDYDESQLIEDKIYLEKVLSEEVGVNLPKVEEEAPIILDEHDEAALQIALDKANDAMELQGFYEDMEAATLLQGEEELSDDILLDEQLKHTATILENSLFFNETIPSDNFIENETVLAAELAKINFIEPITDTESGTVTLDDADHAAMNDALEQVTVAMNVEGLYAPIDTQKLMVFDDNVDQENIQDIYDTKIHSEQAVIEAIGRSIPRASKNQKNNLQQIDGIGMFIEQRLNELGIYTYEQISLFNADFIAKLGTALGFSEQTIARDRWVEQAKDLLK